MSTFERLPAGTSFGRYAKAIALHDGNVIAAEEYAAKNINWRDSPEVSLQLKSATTAMNLATAGAASYGVASGFLAALKPVSVFEQLKSRMFATVFRVKTPVENTSPTGNWTPEAGAIPASVAGFDSKTLEALKIASISAVTKELVRSSAPNAETALRTILTNAFANLLDTKFLDPTLVATANLAAGSITNGSSSVSSTGSSAAQIQADLASMVAALTSWRDPVWVMRLSTATALQARVPTLFSNGLLLGLPVFTSLGVPSQITLVDIASIMFADGNLDISATDQATLEMSTTPISGETSPFQGTTLKALFQNNLIAIKIVREVNWIRTSDSAVVSMVVSY